MSNRTEYAWLAVLLVTVISALFYHRIEWSSDGEHASNVVTTGLGLSGMNNVRGDLVVQDSRSTVETEDGRGLNKLGMIYLNGTGMRRDVSTAFLFLSWAAQTGHVSAMNNLGTMYEKGWGTDSDRKKALELYTKAAQLGNQLARDNLQRLRATYVETGTTPPSPRPPAQGLVQSSRSEKPELIPTIAPDSLGAKSRVGQATILEPSPDTGWSTGAIPPARPVAAQNRAPPQTEKLRGAGAPSEPPVTPQERQFGNPSASKMLATEKARNNKIAEKLPNTNSGGKSAAEMGFVDPVDALLSQPCVVGNWIGTPRC
jgi:Sel1 repeat